MGSYDDLIPKGGSGTSSGTYDDLIPKGGATTHAHADPLSGVRHAAVQGVRNVADWADWIGRNPLARGVGSILGVTERAGIGAASGGLDIASGHKPRTNPIRTIMDPEGDTEATHRLEHQELDKPLAWWNSVMPVGQNLAPGLMVMPTQLHIPETGVGRAILDFATQTAHDLSTYIPGVDAFTIGGRLSRAMRLGRAAGSATRAVGRAIPQGIRDAARARLEHAQSNLLTSHDALQGITRPALNIVRAREGGARHLHAQRSAEYAHALAPHEQGIHDLDTTLRSLGFTAKDLKDPAKLAQIPHAQRHTLREVNRITDLALWRDGTPQVRRSMLKRGYVPSPEERGLPTTNLVERDFGHNYLPEQEIYDPANAAAAKAAKGHTYYRGGVQKASYNKAKTGGQVNAPLFDRFENRLESAAYLEPKRRAEQQVISELGFAPSNLPRTQERMSAIIDRMTNGAALPGDAKRLGAYQRLFGKQIVEADKAKQLREAFTAPGAAHSDAPISGVFSGEQSAQGRAARDLSFLGKDTGNAFEEGGLVNRASTAAAKAKSTGAAVLERRLGSVSNAAQNAQQKTGFKLSQYALKGQKKAENAANLVDQRASKYGADAQKRTLDALRSLRTRQAIERQRDVSSLTKAREAQGLTKSSRMSKIVARIRDTQFTRGGQEYSGIRNAAQARDTASIAKPAFDAAKPVDLSSALKPGERLSQRTIDALNHAQAQAAKHKATLEEMIAKNKNVAEVEKRVKKDKAYNGDLQIPEALHQRLFGDRVQQEPGVAESLGSGAANVLFANPLPHLVGNIFEQQAFAGGGLGALAGGVREAVRLARKDPAAIERINEAKRVGATHEKGYENEEPPKTWPGKAYNALQRGLTVGHEGQVSELFQRYLKAGKTPEEAAEEVRQTFGRPYESSKEAGKFKAAGSNFANWVFSTIPRSTKKAVGSAKGRNALKTYARGVQDANSDVFEPEYGVEFNPGGFASRASSLLLRPAAYLASQSLDNVLHSTGTNAKLNPGDLIKESIPLAGPAMDLTGQPLKPKQRLRGGYKKLPWYLKLPMLTGGYYTHAETPMQKFNRELKREGLK